ncbi:MAG: histidine phosphatase family protein [bacterium]|nr:histidine phosphatase family protein [bacterium]
MNVLLLIRHAQASFLQDDYDTLSPLGEEQADALGAYWADSGLLFDRVFVGPCRRHRQTAEAVAAAYRARKLQWPDPVPLAELDEYEGPIVVERRLAQLIADDPELASLTQRAPADAERTRRYFQVFKKITRQWVRGELETPADLEDWPSFRQRIARALDRIVPRTGDGQTAVAFTSGGTIAAAVGHALGIADGKVLELSWRVRNSACTELLFSEEQLILGSFNTVAHLAEPRLVTYV